MFINLSLQGSPMQSCDSREVVYYFVPRETVHRVYGVRYGKPSFYVVPSETTCRVYEVKYGGPDYCVVPSSTAG